MKFSQAVAVVIPILSLLFRTSALPQAARSSTGGCVNASVGDLTLVFDNFQDRDGVRFCIYFTDPDPNIPQVIIACPYVLVSTDSPANP